MTTAEYYGVARPRRQAAGIEFDPGFSAVIIALLADTWDRYCEWRRLRRAVSELRGLDERMLKDIGLSRSTLYSAAADPEETRGRGHGIH
jgi:uncharacterized protein YjiS (DUF1127 family)